VQEHLQILRRVRLIECEHGGKLVYYCVVDDALAPLRAALS
jgi:hypothetical protein